MYIPRIHRWTGFASVIATTLLLCSACDGPLDTAMERTAAALGTPSEPDEIGLYWTQDNWSCDDSVTRFSPWAKPVGCNNKGIRWNTWSGDLTTFARACKTTFIDRSDVGLSSVAQPCYAGFVFLGWNAGATQVASDGTTTVGRYYDYTPSSVPGTRRRFQCQLLNGSTVAHDIPPYDNEAWWTAYFDAVRQFALAVDANPNVDAILIGTGLDFEMTPVKSDCVAQFQRDYGWLAAAYDSHMTAQALFGPTGRFTTALQGVQKPVRISIRWYASDHVNRLADSLPAKDGVYSAGMAGNEGTKCIYKLKTALTTDEQANNLPVRANPSYALVGGTHYQALRLRRAGKWMVSEYGNTEASVQSNLDGWLWAATEVRSNSQGNSFGNFVMADAFWGPFIRQHLGRTAAEAPSAWVRLRNAASSQVMPVGTTRIQNECQLDNAEYYLWQTNRQNNTWNEFPGLQDGPGQLGAHDLRYSSSAVSTRFGFEADPAFAAAHPGGAGWTAELHVLGNGGSVQAQWWNGSALVSTAVSNPGTAWNRLPVPLAGFAYNPNGDDLVVTGGGGASLTLYLARLVPPAATPARKALFLSQSVPSGMTPGSRAQVQVTMKNVGAMTWTQGGSNPFRLGSQSEQDNLRWGTSRVGLPVASVAPGQQVTFTFDITAPTTPGEYLLQWGMLQEWITWFGDYSPVTKIVVAPNVIQGYVYSEADRNLVRQSTSEPLQAGARLYYRQQPSTTWISIGTSGSACGAPFRLSGLGDGTYDLKVESTTMYVNGMAVARDVDTSCRYSTTEATTACSGWTCTTTTASQTATVTIARGQTKTVYFSLRAR